MQTHKNDKPRSKLPGTWRPAGKGPHDDVEVRFGYAIKHAPTSVAVMHGVTLREVRATEVDGGWRLMFKGNRKGKPVVAYIYHDSYLEALVLAFTTLDVGLLVWHHDDYPPKPSDSPTKPFRF